MLTTNILHRPTIRVPIASRKEQLGWIFLFVTIFSGATYSAFAKSLTSVFTPFSLIFVSEILSLLFLLVSFGVIPTVREVMRVRRSAVVPLLLIGFFSGVLAPFLFFTGLHSTSAVNAVLFGNAEMVFMLLFATMFLGEHWTTGRAIAVCAILAGIVTIALEGFTTNIHLQKGDAYILLAAMGFSIGSIIFRKYLRHSHPEVAMLTRSATAIIFFFLVAPFHSHPFIEELQSFTVFLIPALIGFGFLSKFLNVFAFYHALERLPVSTISLVGSLGIIVSAVFSHVYLGEPIFGYHIGGAILIISGTIVLETFGLQQTKAHLKHRHHHRV